jgi:TPR repeat protein
MLSLGVLASKERDWPEAKMWYEKSAASGNVAALVNLGDIYKNGYGIEVDYAKAKQLYIQAAGLGSTLAMLRLASLYENGLGVPQDQQIADYWLTKARNENAQSR